MKRILVTAVAVAGLAALLGADQLLVAHWRDASARTLQAESALARARMAQALIRRQYTVEAIRSYAAAGSSPEARSFGTVANPLQKADPTTRVLLYTRADGVIAAHSPSTVSGPLTAGTSILKDKVVGPWAETAIAVRADVIECAVSPYGGGKVDLAVILPVLVNDRVIGLAAGVFDLSQIAHEAYPVSATSTFELGLEDEEGKTIIGPRRFAAGHDVGPIETGAGVWQVALGWRKPPPGPPTAARGLIWAFGLAMVLTVLLALHTAWRREEWLQQQAAERALELQFTTEVLQAEIIDRVDAEQALRETDERFRSVFDDGHDLYCRVDVDDVITAVSPSVRRVLGYEPDELVGRRYSELIAAPPQVTGAVLAVDGATQATEHEVEVSRKDGSRAVISITSRPLHSSSGDVIGYESTGRDITARKQAEEALAASEQRYRATLDALGEAVCVVGPDLRVALCNQTFGRLIGFVGADREPVGDPIPDVLPFVPEHVWGNWALTMVGDAETAQETSLRETVVLDGGAATLEVRGVPLLEHGRVAGMVVLVDAPFERDEFEIALPRVETLQPVADRPRSVDFGVDIDGRLTMVSPSAEPVLGYEPDELIGEPMARCFVDTAAFRELADALSAEQTLADYEVMLKRADGSEFPAAMDIRVLHDEEGAACGADGSLRDTTRVEQPVGVAPESDPFRSAFEAADDGIFIIGVDGLFTHANSAMAELTGVPPEDLIGESAAEAFGPEMAEEIEDLDRRVLAGESVNHQIRLERPEGELFVHVVRVPLRDASGEVRGICGIARDLTQTRLYAGAVERRDAIVRAVARTSEELLTGGRWEEAAEGVLEALGEATGAQRVRLLRKRAQDAVTGDSAATLTPVAEWPGQGEALAGATDVLMPAAEARVLAEGGALCDPAVDADGPGTIARLPLMVDDYWWGVLECLRHTEAAGWSEPELAALQSGANILAAGIRQQQTALGLMASEELFRSVFDGLVDVYYRTDADGVVVLTSPSVERVLGRAQEELFGHRMSELWANAEEDAALRGRLTEDGEVTDFRMTAIRADGRHVPVSVTGHILRDAEGKLIGAEGVIRDMTERAQAEAQLRASEERLRALLNATTEMVGLIDLDGRILAANTRLAAADGMSPEQALTRPIYDAMPEPLSQRCRDHVDTVIAAGKPVRFTDQWGENWFDASLYPVNDAGGAVVGVAVFTRDITEQRQAEAALATHLEFVRTLLDRIPNPVFFKSATGVLLGCNAAFADGVLGLPKEEIVGKSIAELEPSIPADLARLYIEYDARLQDSGGIQLYEAEAQVADGGRRDFLFSQAAFADGAGNVAGVVGLMLDITERKRSQQYLSRRQRIEAVGALAAGVAHEFNNILQAVLGRARLMLTNETTPPEARNNLQQMVDVGERGAELVRRLLEFSRREEPQRRILDLSPVVEDACAILQQTIAKRAQVVVSVDDDLRAVEADRRQIEQVLLNLGINAAEAIPESGTITVMAQNQSLPEGHVVGDVTIPPGEYVLLVVADTGTGVDPAAAPHLFEPFYTTKGLASHSGLGLAAAHGIVEAHGGYVGFASMPDEGTAFEVYLPIVADAGTDNDAAGTDSDAAGTDNDAAGTDSGAGEASTAEAGAEKPRPGPHPGGILVVDDEPAVAQLACEILEHLGHVCMQALDEQTALDLIGSHRGELGVAIVDVEIASPGERNLVEQLREAVPELQIVGMVSGDAAPTLVEQTAPHLAGLLRKPFGVGDLAEAVENALRS